MLRWVFLESVPALAVVSGLALFILLVQWRRTLQPRPMIIGLIVVAILFAAQTAITTPREHFHAMMTPVEHGVEDGDVAAVVKPFVAEFVAGDMGRAAFADWVAAQLRRIDVEGVRRLRSTVELDGGGWVAEVSYSGMISTEDLKGQLITCSWRIWFRRLASGDYVITRIEPLKVNGQAIRDWQSLERF